MPDLSNVEGTPQQRAPTKWSDWKNESAIGRMSRTRIGESGQLIEERYVPKHGRTMIRETFGNAFIRGTYRWDTPDKQNDIVATMDPTAFLPYVRYLETGTFLANIDPDLKDNITINLGINRTSIYDTVTDDEANVNLKYQGNDLLSCKLQAERPSAYEPHQEEEQVSLGDRIGTLINYLDTRGDAYLSGAKQSALANLEQEGKGLEGSELMDSAEALAIETMGKLIKLVPPEKIDQFRVKIAKMGLYEKTLSYILIDAQGQVDAVKEMDSDTFLEDMVNDALDIARGPESTVAQEALVIDEFSDGGFGWREVEIEDEFLTENPQARDWKDMFRHEENIRQRSVSKYGSEIRIQEDSFIVERSGDMINVICRGKDGQQKWTSSFSLKIPSREVLDMLDPSQKDFRKIKYLAQATLRT